MTVVRIMRFDHADTDLGLPSYETAGAAGMDLRACLPEDERALGRTLAPLARSLVPTGLGFALPEGFEAQVRPRSGLAARHGVTVLNAPGTVDADYRGEVAVILINLGADPFTIAHGDRIAQVVIARVTQAAMRVVAVLDDTDRGASGFGSTGVT